jgi:hypothetical protein
VNIRSDLTKEVSSTPSSVEPPATAQQDRPKPLTPPLGDDSEAQISAATKLFHREEYARCLAIVRDLDGEAAADPRATALFGACRALVLGEVLPGLDACIRALKSAFYIPDLYCALGAVLQRIGDRSKAYATYQKGLRVDPLNRALRARIHAMGQRRQPVLTFLPRTHQANRLLGIARSRLFSP